MSKDKVKPPANPGSEEAIKAGCQCLEQSQLNIFCPLHGDSKRKEECNARTD
jgi:hypothetical protein